MEALLVYRGVRSPWREKTKELKTCVFKVCAEEVMLSNEQSKKSKWLDMVLYTQIATQLSYLGYTDVV